MLSYRASFRETAGVAAAAVLAALAMLALSLAAPAGLAAQSAKQEGCTVIGAGRLATVDGSVITSHSDCCSECRIQVIPARTHPKGALADVHWGMVYFGAEDDRRALPLGDFGRVIGRLTDGPHRLADGEAGRGLPAAAQDAADEIFGRRRLTAGQPIMPLTFL